MRSAVLEKVCRARALLTSSTTPAANMASVRAAIRRMETRTRRYAKRQRTWMRRLPEVRVVDATRDAGAVAGDIAGWT